MSPLSHLSLLSPLSLCLYETCESGGCENVLVANGEVEVISVKKTSFASIVAILTARCGDCDGNRKETDSCGSKPCLNGGTCVEIPEGRFLKVECIELIRHFGSEETGPS